MAGTDSLPPFPDGGLEAWPLELTAPCDREAWRLEVIADPHGLEHTSSVLHTVCLYVYIYIYVCTFIYPFSHSDTPIYICMYIYIYIYICARVCESVHLYLVSPHFVYSSVPGSKHNFLFF